jgi:riboflavin kinase/FMN adenylyltransferase
MQVHKDIDHLPSFRNAVVTIGTFDGVHQGHRQIIDEMLKKAKSVDGETVIITFHPHPRKVVSSTILGIRLINTLEERIQLLAELGIDHVVVVPFTEAFANQPADDYVRNFLAGKFRPHTIIIGYDHRFGRDRQGDYRLLEEKAGEYGFRLTEIPKHILENISISSTRIRESILNHDFATANKLLGYEFFFSGIVVDGDKLGRKLGYPTANLKIQDEEKIIPGNGIYAVYASLNPPFDWLSLSPSTSKVSPPRVDMLPPEDVFKGMMSIGFRPTVDGKKRVIEVNLFDFDKDIYGQTLTVIVKKYLREEKKFDSLEALVKQIDQDKVDSLAVL